MNLLTRNSLHTPRLAKAIIATLSIRPCMWQIRFQIPSRILFGVQNTPRCRKTKRKLVFEEKGLSKSIHIMIATISHVSKELFRSSWCRHHEVTGSITLEKLSVSPWNQYYSRGKSCLPNLSLQPCLSDGVKDLADCVQWSPMWLRKSRSWMIEQHGTAVH